MMNRFYTLIILFFSTLLMSLYAQKDNIILKKDFIYEQAPFIECHASTIESTPQGMVAAWFGGTKEANPDVEIWVSHYDGEKWSTPVSVADGVQHEGKRYPCWNPVLFQVPNGELLLFYKVGSSPSEWWGMLKRSVDGGHTWSVAERLPEDILGPIKNRPFLTSDGRLICPSSTEVNPNEGWRLHFEITPDLGKSWLITPSITDPKELNAIQPSILMYGNDNTLQAIARSKDGGVVDSWSYDGGRTWSDVKSTELPNPNSGTDATTTSEGLQVLIYNHCERPEGKWSGQRSPLNIGISVDGIKWHNIVELENEKGEYSYPAVVQAEDGKIHITYTWKRRKIRHVIVDQEAIFEKYPEIKKELDSKRDNYAQKKSIPVIFDTDMGNDIDDALALAMLYNYQKKGLVNLLGITINKANGYTKPFIDIMNHYYNYSKIPIGYIGDNGPTPEDGAYLRPVVEAKNAKNKRLFNRKLNVDSKLPESWKLQRKLLASQPDQSVTIISVGFSSNLKKLLESKADEYSPLSGIELVRNKVKLLSVMAGNFVHTSKSEYNVAKDIPSAKYVFENWPTKIVFGGWEIGAAVKYPATSITQDFVAEHPIRLGYENFLQMPYDRETWDLISVLVAVEGCGNGLSLSDFGKVEVSDKGTTDFKKSINGMHQILIIDKSQKDSLMDKLIKVVTDR